MKKVLLMSAAALLIANISYAAGENPPTCEELGYKYSAEDCVNNNMIKCPHDESKVFCSQSCAAQGYTQSTPDCGKCATLTCSWGSDYKKCGGLTVGPELEVVRVINGIHADNTAAAEKFTLHNGAPYPDGNVCIDNIESGKRAWVASLQTSDRGYTNMKNQIVEQWMRNNGFYYISENFESASSLEVCVDKFYCDAASNAYAVVNGCSGLSQEECDSLTALYIQYFGSSPTISEGGVGDTRSIYATAKLMNMYDCANSKINLTLKVESYNTSCPANTCKITLKEYYASSMCTQ